jgi:ribosome biogenesis protein
MEVGLQLFTKDEDFPLPSNLITDNNSMPVRVPLTFDRKALMEMVNQLLQSSQNFDFLVNGEYLRTSLDEYLQKHNTSSEQLLQVEYILSATKPSLIKQYPTDEWIKSVHFFNGSVVSGSFDGILRVHDEDSKVIATHEDCNVNGIANINETLITAGQNGEVRFWNTSSGQLAYSGLGAGHDSSIESLSVSKNIVCSGNWVGKVLIHELPQDIGEIDESVNRNHKKRKLGSSKGVQPKMVLRDHLGCVSATNFTRNYLFTAGWDHCIRKYDSEYNLVDTAKFDSVVNALSGTDILVSGHSDGLVRLTDPRSDKIVQTFVKQPNQISAVQVSDTIVASSCYDGCVRFFDMKNSTSVMYSVQVAKSKKLFDIQWCGTKIAVGGECADIFLIEGPK